MIIYRVEDETGNGPYATGGPHQVPHMGWEHTNDRNHPSPQEDMGVDSVGTRVFRPWVHFCGGHSLQQLATWFEGWVEKLKEHGHTVAVYEVSEEFVIHGKYQIAFERNAARLVHRMPIDVLKAIS